MIGSPLDGFAYALVGTTATDISLHSRVNVLIRGIGIVAQQRNGRHNLSGLTIPALRHLFGDPGFLHPVQSLRSNALYGSNLLTAYRTYRQTAAAHRQAIQVYRTGTAQTLATAKTRAGQTQVIPQYPQQGCICICGYGKPRSINGQLKFWHDEQYNLLTIENYPTI